MGRSKSKGRKNEQYATPQWCVDALARRCEERLPVPDWIVDLGAGDGRIGLSVRRAFEGCGHAMLKEIDDGRCMARPRLLLLDVVQEWSKKDLYSRDEFLIASFPECEDHAYQTIEESRVLFVSNPPFSLSTDWVTNVVVKLKTDMHSPGSAAVFMLRLDWMATKKRSALISKHPPDRIDVLVPRPSFTGGGTDMREYGWFWWTDAPYRGTEIGVADKK